MQFLILSDPHANWEALQAVLEDAEGEYERIICCGDLVGYNPDPAAVVDWVRHHCSAVIRGNHDKVVSGIEGIEWFNEVAQAAAMWTIEQLDEEQLSYLRQLTRGPLQLEHFYIWHGSPMDEDKYVIQAIEAAPCFSYLDNLPLAFFGHTHLQGGFASKPGGLSVTIPAVRKNVTQQELILNPDKAYLFNPGSVGQPRDRDPRAAYALYNSDEKRVLLRRIRYDVEKTNAKIRAAGLPEVLGARLKQGI